MIKKLAALSLCLATFSANAYFVTVFKDSKIDYTKPTRILVTGAGDDLGSQFQFIAKAKAVKYRDEFPNDQIVLVAHEETDLGNDEVILRNFGFNLIKNDKSSFNGNSFVEEVSSFTQIASIDVFSHSSAQYGAHLDGKAHRLTTNTKGIDKLKGHFMKGAYAYLHGCNTGFNLAPYLSQEWGIPVAGSMTSTNFQKLHSDGNFYQTEEGFYPNSDWQTSNKQSFLSGEVTCKEGGCLRLKPDNHPYVGYWGEYYEGGLPFYKFFCATNSDEECKKAMAQSLLSFTAVNKIDSKTSFADYKKTVIDFLCPISAKKDIRRECEENLDLALKTGDETYNPFSRPLVQCDLHKCEVEITCKKIMLTGIYKPGTCVLDNKYNGKATTMVREYKAYLDAYKYLNL
jgi:hypothetical protein